LVNIVERRDTLEESASNLQRRRSSEQSTDQTWQGQIIFVVSSILLVLERQSYLLSIIAMLVKIKKPIIILIILKMNYFRHGV